jgi:hypothetical protein
MFDYYLTGYLIAIGAILFALAAVAMVVYVIYYYVIAGLLTRTTQVPASVLRRRQSGSDSLPSVMDVLTSGEYSLEDEVSGPYDYFIMFDVHGREVEFPVPEAVYANLMEGDTGWLVHKGNLFRQFIPADIGLDSSGGRAEIRKV